MKQYKCVTVGDLHSGKTKLLIAFTTNARPGEQIPTVFDNYAANVMAKGIPPVNLSIWDIDPSEDSKKLRPLLYAQTDVFLFCFSLVQPLTLQLLECLFFREIKEFCPDVPIVLVGTDLDLRDGFEERADEYKSKYWEPIPTSKGEEFARKIGASSYYEVSIPKFKNITELFEGVAKAAYEYKEKPEKTKSEGGCEIF